ncbi:YolD-like family protein [Paenibacillus sp. N4]|uniref:YolD-like family protein n=1 Tax=Paenibacillus vietnamensis TaxID=2590547 RepID=UPI001CD09E50|nr:YolD-like family protein [Paenibacillus vietnamensis]MCA0754927.1 YolD-like family protein [Paenibacillus vietnamensis]
MAKKLSGNGFWESSRMMLPEHKARIIELAHEQKKRQRIELDEQEWEDVSRAVAQSMQQRQPVKLRMFHELEELEVFGVVDRVDQLRGRFMVDGEWFAIQDIEGASIEGN